MEYPDERHDPETSHQSSWTTALYRFTQTTTIDGVKQAAEPTPFWFRRVIWICLLIGGVALFVKQLTDSVSYYRSRPVTVNTDIKYNKTLKFPAVTICNQNNFRATVASRRGQFSLISDIYVKNSSDTNSNHSFYSESVFESMFALRHDKHDLIVSCQWDNMNCSADEFITAPTDHGVCYSFNNGFDDKPVRYIAQTGTDGGLRLKLNIEQYEYMQGPNEGAGLKVLIHDQGDVALVRDLGLAVKIHNLAPPHGQCEEKNLTLYKEYTMSSCLLECRTLYVTSVCGCIDFYMPWETSGGPPFCSLRQFLECVRPVLEVFNAPDECECPVPCNMTVFNPSITFLANSNFDMEKMMHRNHSELVKKYALAQEVRQRVDTFVSKDDHKMADELNKAIYELNDLFMGITWSLTSIEDEMIKIFNEMNQRIRFHHRTALDGVRYVVRHNFIRGWEIIDERTFPYVSRAFFELHSAVSQLFSNLSEKDELTREVQLHTLSELIQNKLYLCGRAKGNLTKIYNAYKTGVPLLNFKKTLHRRYDLGFISLELLHSVVENGDREVFYTDVYQAVETIEDSLRKLDSALHSDEGLPLALEAVEEFVDGCKKYNQKMYLFKDRIVLAPLKEIDHKIGEFQKKASHFDKTVNQLLDMTFEIRSTIKMFNRSTWQLLLESVNLFLDYVHGHSISKMNVAEAFKSRKMLMTLLTVQQFFGNLVVRLRDVQDLFDKFESSYLDVFHNMLLEPSTLKFYNQLDEELGLLEVNSSVRSKFDPYFAYLLDIRMAEVSQLQLQDLYILMNADFASTNWTVLVNDTTNLTNRLKLKSKHSSTIGEVSVAFINTMGAITESLKTFKGRNKIDPNFYRENFIHLDIFFHELSYQKVTHQKAYDLTNLLSDIGGLVELFLGASILSLLEIFDFLIFTSFNKCRSSNCFRSAYKKAITRNRHEGSMYKSTPM